MSIEGLYIQYKGLLTRLFDIMPIIYLSANDLGDVNGQQVTAFGGVQDVNSYTVLNNIVTTASGIGLGTDVIRKTFSHYLYYISKQKPFYAHNSRTGALSALYFLELNGRTWNGEEEILIDIAQKAELNSSYTWQQAYSDVVSCGVATIS